MAERPRSDGEDPRLICRCEEVASEALLGAIAEGARSLDDLKRRTRAGMGPCQGIYCAPELADLLARRVPSGRGVDPAAIPPMTARPPARPLPLALLAATTPEEP